MTPNCVASLMTVLTISIDAPPTASTAPSAEQLLSRATLMSSLDPACRTFELEFETVDPVPLRFRGAYAAPDRISFVVCDANDGVPIAAGSADSIVFYDPINGRLDYRNGVKIGFTLGLKDEEIRFGFGIAGANDRDGQAHVDVKSFTQIPAKRTLIPEGSEIFKIVCLTERSEKPDKDRCVFHVDLKSKNPFSRIDFLIGGEKKPVLSITKLRLNESIPPSAFAFPSQAEAAKRIPLSSNDGLTAKTMSSIDCFKGIAARDLSRKNASRGNAANRIGVSEAELKSIHKNDALYAAALKALFDKSKPSSRNPPPVSSDNQQGVRK